MSEKNLQFPHKRAIDSVRILDCMFMPVLTLFVFLTSGNFPTSPSKINTAFSLLRWLLIVLLFTSPLVFFYLNETKQFFLTSIDRIRTTSRTFNYHLVAASITLTLLLYLSTGTLSPYANLLDQSYIRTDTCNYLYNGDYDLFAALYYLVDGKSVESWGYSSLLRRILYNVAAYPLMKIAGHDCGGVVFNVILAWLGLLSFSYFLYYTIGSRGAITGIWLYSLFPGTTYFAGQPFLYGLISPATLWLYILLWKAVSSDNLKKYYLICIMAGVLCTGYDFLVFIAPALCIALIISKRYRYIFPGLVCLILPISIWWLILKYMLGGHFSSDNSSVYMTIAKSWISTVDFKEWAVHLKRLPLDFIKVFLSAGFLFTPILALIGICLSKAKCLFLQKHGVVCFSLFISIASVFLFNNAAPPYEHVWQMRGDWLARLYEPVFVIYLIYIVASVQILTIEKNRFKTGIMTFSILCCMLGNAMIITGPVLNDPFKISSTIYWNFYKHYEAENMQINLETFGKRPIGFCR